MLAAIEARCAHLGLTEQNQLAISFFALINQACIDQRTVPHIKRYRALVSEKSNLGKKYEFATELQNQWFKTFKSMCDEEKVIFPFIDSDEELKALFYEATDIYPTSAV